ncbi:hypothetical protein H6P81_006016 [Aristolochia fimbriata]|uniref:Glutaredoxin domain-containing protein n=1 Tax=Aristolochia fimbriata TaxID=158543 RepID=A0AAV7EWA4_ARIFI|nr:hypothetical protein H6P81_006016 [Aristolochia fimbriata]
MGCASSHLLEDDDEYGQMTGPGGLSHHIVSLTSTTYGILTTLDYPRPQTISLHPGPLPEPRPREPTEVINSWELMAGLDTNENNSFRLSPPAAAKSSLLHTVADLDSRIAKPVKPLSRSNVLRPLDPNIPTHFSFDGYEVRCPPGGEKAVVIYTTSLRGIRKTFEDCNSVRSALDGLGVKFIERDVSMDSGFRKELEELMDGKGENRVPRVFVRGRYIGGVEEVMRLLEEGGLGKLVEGLPKGKIGAVCDGCGGVRFLPCFECNGSCKVVKEGRKVIRCSVCNENGLVLCPLCT